MATKKKYYVVWEGKKTGIFNSWKECELAVKGIQGAKYKSFKTLQLAKEAYKGKYEDYKGKTFTKSELSQEQLAIIGQPNLHTISVDAACSGNPGIMEYQGVETATKKIIFKKGPFKNSTNNIGEFLALVHALALLKQKNDTRPIYSDSKIAIKWVKNKQYKTSVERTKENNDTFELLDRAVNWLKKNTYSSTIIKWETKAWGEIPADFGRK